MEEPKPEVKPTTVATLDLVGGDVGLAKKAEVKVGSRMRIVLTGIVKETGQEASDDMTVEGPVAGKLVLDVQNLRIGSNNEIADLFNEEIDG